jgi:hypothetical protein
VELAFTAEMWFWRGPAPFHFVTVPEQHCPAIVEASAVVSYGWGMIPVSARIGATEWDTAMWPKDGGYILPIKTAVRRAEGLELGDAVPIRVLVADD